MYKTKLELLQAISFLPILAALLIGALPLLPILLLRRSMLEPATVR